MRNETLGRQLKACIGWLWGKLTAKVIFNKDVKGGREVAPQMTGRLHWAEEAAGARGLGWFSEKQEGQWRGYTRGGLVRDEVLVTGLSDRSQKTLQVIVRTSAFTQKEMGRSRPTQLASPCGPPDPVCYRSLTDSKSLSSKGRIQETMSACRVILSSQKLPKYLYC